MFHLISLIFVASKLLNAKTEEPKSNQILNYIFVIVIVFKCIRLYAWGYTLVRIMAHVP